MSRFRRNYIPGAVHHAISRFHGGAYRLREPIEREQYLRHLAFGLKKTDWYLLAYALMSTHIHLVFLAGQMPPHLVFQSTHSAFATWLNRRQSMHGHLFSDRYKLWAVRSPTAALIAYVHNNPVRAGVVNDAANSIWTSHRYFLGSNEAPKWLSTEKALELAGLPDGQEFDNYVRRDLHTPRDQRWSGELDKSIIQDSHQATGVAAQLGEPVISDTMTYPILTSPRAFTQIRGNYSPEQILEAVSRVIGISRRAFCGRSKTINATRARRLGLRLWRSMVGTQSEMCSALGMSSTAASGLLQSTSKRHLQGDDERVRLELHRLYPQGI